MTRLCWRAFAMIGVLMIPGVQRVFACSCPMSGPPCQATWTADAVFAGTVTSMTAIPHESLGSPFQSTLVKFSVERTFVGAPTAAIEVVTGMGGGDCGYRFKVGDKYLVYASKDGSSHLSTGICSRTRRLVDAEEDLRYLTTMNGTGSGGRLYGRITEWRRDPAERQPVDYGPVEGITVGVRGTTYARQAVTAADGRFEVPNLPIGKATVSIVFPFGFTPSAVERQIEIRDLRACSPFDMSIEPIAQASGFVVDAAGRPVAGVSIEAVAAELASFDPEPYQSPATTDQRGAFEFQNLPPGQYVFGINLTKIPNSRPRTGAAVYLPGTHVASEATVIELKAGDRKEIGAVRLIQP